MFAIASSNSAVARGWRYVSHAKLEGRWSAMRAIHQYPTKNCMPVRSSGDRAPSILLELVKKVPPDQRNCIGNPASTRMKASSSIGHHGDVARQDHLRWPHRVDQGELLPTT